MVDSTSSPPCAAVRSAAHTPSGNAPGDLDREPGLAAAGRPHDRHQPMRCQQPGDAVALGVTPDQPGVPGPVGEIPTARSDVGGARRRATGVHEQQGERGDEPGAADRQRARPSRSEDERAQVPEPHRAPHARPRTASRPG